MKKICLNCGKEFEPKRGSKGKYCSNLCWLNSKEHKDNISKSLTGHPKWGGYQFPKGMKPNKASFREGHIPWHKGRAGNMPKYFLDAMLRGEKHPNWQGGITPKRCKICCMLEYRLWRKAVFERDNYTCRKCGIHSEKGKAIYLQAHHIKSFAQYPELRFVIDNGLTLCIRCHRNIRKINYDTLRPDNYLCAK